MQVLGKQISSLTINLSLQLQAERNKTTINLSPQAREKINQTVLPVWRQNQMSNQALQCKQEIQTNPWLPLGRKSLQAENTTKTNVQ